MNKIVFPLDFLRLLDETRLLRIARYVGEAQSLSDRPNRIHLTSLLEIARVSSGEAGIVALHAILGASDRRNTALAIPLKYTDSFTARQLEMLERYRARQRQLRKRASIQKYPHLFFETDDLSALWREYIDRDLGTPITQASHVCTLGSCFAMNIARHLTANGYSAFGFELGELVNNVYTNNSIIDNIRFGNLVSDEVEALQPGFRERVNALEDNLKKATHIVFTVGLSLAFFTDEGGALREPIYSYRQIHYKGYTMKPIPVEENTKGLRQLMESIKEINPDATLIVSLSPIPLDGAMSLPLSVIEADCLSKAIGRAAIGYLQIDQPDLFYYYPSFELVRWAAANRNVPLFGGDAGDGEARHITKEVIREVLDVFISVNCKNEK